MQLGKHLLVLVLPLLISCGGENNKSIKEKKDTKQNEAVKESNNPAAKVEGRWRIMRAEGNMRSMNTGTVYEFSENTLTMSKSGFSNTGKTKITDSTFSFQDTGSSIELIYNYRFNGDTLVAEVQGSNGQFFYLVRE